jgi:peptidoglycan/LPS O-acetylase OafA/YrhL
LTPEPNSRRSVETGLGREESRSAPGGFRIEYRGDIEGLRAVAILLVVAAHAGVPWLEGGYVGVDVFFVLSGYLITALLVQEVQATGGVRLLEFYARRLRRLLPALMLMVVCTIGMAAALLAPFEQLEQTATAGAASIWLSNVYFAFLKLDYFGPAADTNLFLHTWSLGVEEQFYVFWPAWLMFLLGTWRWQGVKQDFRRLRYGMAVTAGLCLILSVFLTFTQPSWAFYLMPSRAWQFALGALAFLGSMGGSCGRSRGMTSGGWSDRLGLFIALSGWAGLILILLSAVFLDAHIPYPGGWALLPSIGTAAVLVAGSTPSPASIGRVLSISPFQRVGNVSYAWYLWHWPILLLGATLGSFAEPFYRAGLVAVSLALAILSNRVVETPLRRSAKLSSRPRLTLATSFVLMVGAVALSAGWMRATFHWLQQPEQRRYQEIRFDMPVLYSMGCDEWFRSARVNLCQFGPEDAEHTAVLMGDSIALQWFPAFFSVYNQPGWRLLVLTKSSCPMVDESFFYKRIGAEYVVCNAWRDAALNTVQSLKPEVVFLGSSADYPFGQDQWESGTERVLNVVAAAARNVFIIRAMHSLPFDGPNCLARRDWRRQLLQSAGDCSADAGSPRESEVHAWLEQAASSHDNVRVLDLNPLVCLNGRCEAERSGQIVFRDSQHISARYVEALADALAKEIHAVRTERFPGLSEEPRLYDPNFSDARASSLTRPLN